VDDQKCHLEDVAAYLDGEMNGAALEDFEEHLKTCGECATELRTQRQLLCTLEVAFGSERAFELPPNFARIVTAHAESDLSGMRLKKERRRAFQVCAILSLASFALLGAAARALVFDPARSFLRAVTKIAELAWQTVYDAATGVTILVRVIGRAVLLAPYGLGYLFLITFLISISLLFLLIAKYHRKQIIE
jgi:anti-sigma factor RsiW